MNQDTNKILRVASIVIFVLLSILLGIQSWVLPVAFVIVLAFLMLTVQRPKTAILLILISKPILDATWEFKIPYIGLNFLQITGVAFPVVIFLIIYSNKIHFRNYKALVLYGLFVVINCLSYFFSTIGQGDSISEGMLLFVKGSGVLFQFLNSYAAYLIMPYLFESESDHKELFWALVLAGIFPAITGILQINGVIAGRTLRTTGELVRMSGFYHDSVNMRMYSFQTLLAIYVYMSAYMNNKDRYVWLQKILCYFLIPVLILIIYKGYSKASLAILVSWIIVYSVLKGRVVTGSAVLVLILASYTFSDTVKDETDRLLYKEMRFAEGTLPEELQYTMLGGRFVYWGEALDDFATRDLASQMMGYDYVGAATTHNDFIRILVANGIVGFSIYVLLMIYILFTLINSFVRNKDPLSMAAIMIFTSFLIDSIGLIPLLYPGYCWIVFGIISLSLHRNISTDRRITKLAGEKAALSNAAFKEPRLT